MRLFSFLFFFCSLLFIVQPINAVNVPIYVMLPLNTVNNDLTVHDPATLSAQLKTLKSSASVDGVMLDVWWGLVERDAPTRYTWTPYQQIVQLVRAAGLRLRCVMSFHQCGGNVGDACDIPLPTWVMQIGASNPDIFYTDVHGYHNPEYLSLGIDDQPILTGRTPIEVYSDFMTAFRDSVYTGNEDVIDQVQISLGPAGELRYPSYPLSMWTFPGVGEFQCYDSYLKAQLAAAAAAIGHPEWGHAGPSNAGNYNSLPSNAAFFSDGTTDNYASPYGQFFLSWYSSVLIDHGAKVLNASAYVFGNLKITVAAKVSGVHWWYKTNSHAAELTAGYYNTNNQNGYLGIAQMFSKYGAHYDFTCMEMLDSEQNNCGCGPQELVAQTHDAANQAGIAYAGENALPRYDSTAYNTIEGAARSEGYITSFNYLRLTTDLLQPSNLQLFASFVNTMHNL